MSPRIPRIHRRSTSMTITPIELGGTAPAPAHAAVHLVGNAPAANPPASARAKAPSKSTLDRWERQRRLIDDAQRAGFAEGEAQGRRDGLRWGIVCGAIAAALLTSAAWLAVRAVA